MKTRLFDDLAQMAGGSMSILSGLRAQVKSEVKVRVEEMAERLDLVPRSDYEMLEAQVKEYRLKQEEMEQRLAELEKSGSQTKTTSAKKKGTSS